jgi:hypothetical protein
MRKRGIKLKPQFDLAYVSVMSISLILAGQGMPKAVTHGPIGRKKASLGVVIVEKAGNRQYNTSNRYNDDGFKVNGNHLTKKNCVAILAPDDASEGRPNRYFLVSDAIGGPTWPQKT